MPDAPEHDDLWSTAGDLADGWDRTCYDNFHGGCNIVELKPREGAIDRVDLHWVPCRPPLSSTRCSVLRSCAVKTRGRKIGQYSAGVIPFWCSGQRN